MHNTVAPYSSEVHNHLLRVGGILFLIKAIYFAFVQNGFSLKRAYSDKQLWVKLFSLAIFVILIKFWCFLNYVFSRQIINVNFHCTIHNGLYIKFDKQLAERVFLQFYFLLNIIQYAIFLLAVQDVALIMTRLPLEINPWLMPIKYDMKTIAYCILCSIKNNLNVLLFRTQ